jgi:hypothetical protein
MAMPKTVNGKTIQAEWLSHNHPMVMSKIFNGITIQLQVVWLSGNHPMDMPTTFNGITIQFEWLCRRQHEYHPMVMPKTFNAITIPT